jgi:hypothetical protein
MLSKRILLTVVMVPILSLPAHAQDVLPSTTNPAERIVYRGDMTVEDQQAQQLACYQWSSEQTEWDPEKAFAKLEQEHGEALAQYQSTSGGAVRGAAGGALAGLAIGAIAGDAGKGAAIGAVAGGAAGGARARRGRAAAQEAFEAAVAEFQSGFRLWDRHWVACMIGNDYGVG